MLNLVGYLFASLLNLPLWLDSIGTFLSAVFLGPLAGAITGGCFNLIMSIFEFDFLWFTPVSIIGGLAVGLLFPRNRKYDSFTIIGIALVTGIIMTAVSTPINILVHDGYTGNEWGDALMDMLAPSIKSKIFCSILGSLFVNMPDKVLTILIAMSLYFTSKLLKKKRDAKGNSKGNSKALMLLLLAAASSFVFPGEKVSASVPFNHDFSQKTYGRQDGLVSTEINTIVQTKDGFIWAGAYSGLYRHNGNVFEQFILDDKISNAMYLFCDSLGRLWVCTNDAGIFVYNVKDYTGDYITVDDGLPSNSVRIVCEDDNNNFYIGTSGGFCVYRADGSIRAYDEEMEHASVYSVDYLGNGYVTGVTRDGLLFILKDGELIHSEKNSDSENFFTAVCGGMNDELAVGTSGSEIIVFTMEKDGSLFCSEIIDIPEINYTNSIYYDEHRNGFFIAATKGMAFLDENYIYSTIEGDSFDSAISQIITDYQNNIWFASTKQGVFKLSENPFKAPYFELEDAANCIIERNGELYIGTDSGLFVYEEEIFASVTDDITEYFEGVRIRNIMKDQNDFIWFSTYGTQGLVLVSPDNKIVPLEVKNGFLGNRFRFSLELNDGSVLVSSQLGLTFVEGYIPTVTLGIDDGITSQILCAVQREDGIILAGSDGGGIYVIKDKKVIGNIGGNEGLSSLVILRIIPVEEGYIYVTSNGLYYGNGGYYARYLKNFPYRNNYDIFVTEDGRAWVSSSAGIYIANVEDIILDESYNYLLLNHNRGLDTTLTANAWDYYRDDKLYLCCTDGIRFINTKEFNKVDGDYNITIPYLESDGEELDFVDGVYNIPAGNKDILMEVAVLNYSLLNPLINISIEGLNRTSKTLRQDEISEIYYSGIPYGDYTLLIEVYDDITYSVIKSYSFPLHKEARLYEKMYFKVYLFIVCGMMVAFIAWIIAKMGNMAVINRQYEQIREAKEEAENANKAKSIFLANMSHEIRTPINTVLGMDEMILRETGEEEIKNYASDIYSAGKNLLYLINDILDSSKIESGKMEIVPVEYKLVGMVRGLVNMISGRAASKDLKFTVEVDESLPSVLFGDDVRIRQIITNILTNAVKYTHEGGVTMRLGGTSADGVLKLHVEVEDTGIGIKEEDIPKLFEAFKRIEEGRNRNIEGTGLGMNITMQLLKMMGSELKVQSVYGKGSIFSFDLNQKIIDEKPVGKFDVAKSELPKDFAKGGAFVAPDARILCVDDNEMNRKVIRSLLKVTKIQVIEASSGKSALEKAEKEKFDMVLMDHMMPDMDGIETMERMRKIEGYDKIPIYILTANAVTGAKEQYLAAGFDGFISKPVVSAKLEKSIKEALPEELVKAPDPNDVKASENNRAASPDFISELPGIDGVDWNYAFMHLPDEELLKNTVEGFRNTISLQADKLDSMYESKDTEAYRIQVHAMKSSAATVGIVPLAGMAKMLEFAAKDGNEEIIENMHGVFIKEWRSYEEKLSEAFSAEEEGEEGSDKESSGEGSEVLDTELLSGYLTLLATAVDDCDVDKADEIMAKIKKMPLPKECSEQIKKLSAAVT
ncbi:MAG: response regulator, partial [Lachnospiraceae bacterium]|nr:response regulator [Lachnospiraceae bacterium]